MKNQLITLIATILFSAVALTIKKFYGFEAVIISMLSYITALLVLATIKSEDNG